MSTKAIAANSPYIKLEYACRLEKTPRDQIFATEPEPLNKL